VIERTKKDQHIVEENAVSRQMISRLVVLSAPLYLYMYKYINACVVSH